MTFKSLLEVPQAKLVEIELAKKPTAKATKKMTERGCDFCPQNKVKGVNKIFTKVRGRDIMVFTTTPSRQENEDKKLLQGDSGKFFWDEMSKVGLAKTDCDIQAAVRCFPSDRVDGNLNQRDPKKEEIHCCSEYSDKAKTKGKAKVYIILGGMAHTAVLGKEFKKSRKIFWSPTLKARVYFLAHPNYFLRGQYPKLALDEFRDALRSVAQDIKGGKPVSQYAFVEAQKYIGCNTIKKMLLAKKLVMRAKEKGIRVTVDIEHDVIDGKPLMLCCGFCIKPGEAYSIIVDHPQARKVDGKWKPLHPKVRNKAISILNEILSDGDLRKALHQGDTDTRVLEKDLDIHTKGYDFDTIYAEFLAHPDRRAYGLNAIGMQRYPQFGDYKTIILPECIPPKTNIAEHKLENKSLDDQYKYVSKNDLMHFSYLPLRKLVLRNCADADLTKRIELSTKKKISLPLLQVYKDAAYVLAEMTPNGPDFDYLHCKKITNLYPPKYARVLAKLRKIAGKKDFKPTAPKQVQWLLYTKCKIVPPEIAFDKKKKGVKKGQDGKLYVLDKKLNKMVPMSPGTGKNILELLGRKFEVARLLTEFRKLGKIISTYITSFKKCADYNGGRLRTKWWLTGTETGRLSSGGEKGADKDKTTKIVNLQNIHGDKNLQNLATPDKQWRKLYKAVRKAVMSVAGVDLAQIQSYVKKLQGTKDKDKKKALSDKVYAFIADLKKRLSKSKRFKRLCKAILKIYGNIRVLLGFDQGQIEVRVMAQASGDKNLRRDCMGKDIHSKVGHRMTGWSVEKIMKDKKTRTLTKNIHFGILFGLGAAGLMAFIKLKDPDSTLTEEEAQELYNNYFKEYPGVRRFIERMRAFVEKHGYVENMFGFIRPLGHDKSVKEKYEGSDDEQDEGSEGGPFWGNQAINCLDFKTEALTQRGWVKGQDLRKGDILLTKNASTGNLEWQAAQDVKIYPDYEQPLMLFQSRTFNAASTLNHRWLTGGKYKKCKLTADITQDSPIHRTGNYLAPAISPYTDDFIRLAGWYLTDGYHRKGEGYSKSACGICQSKKGNPKKVQMIDELFTRMASTEGLVFRTKKEANRKDEVFWTFAGEYGIKLRALFPGRSLTPQFLVQLTAKQLNILMHTMVLGDGTGSKLDVFGSKHKGSTGKSNCKIQFGTSSKKTANAFQMLVSMVGKHASMIVRDFSAYNKDRKQYTSIGNNPIAAKKHYVLTICRRVYAKIYPEHKRLIKNVGVWCPVVPNTYFVARRKGCVFITGNTPIQGAAHQLMLMAIAVLHRKKKKYRPLGVPTIEVHDYLGFKTKLKDLLTALPLCKHLLEKEPLAVVKKHFPEVKWDLPLVVEGKVGFRLGDSVDLNESQEMHEILGNMFLESWINEIKLDADLELLNGS